MWQRIRLNRSATTEATIQVTYLRDTTEAQHERILREHGGHEEPSNTRELGQLTTRPTEDESRQHKSFASSGAIMTSGSASQARCTTDNGAET